MRRWDQLQTGRRLAAYPAARRGPSAIGVWPRAEAGLVFTGEPKAAFPGSARTGLEEGIMLTATRPLTDAQGNRMQSFRNAGPALYAGHAARSRLCREAAVGIARAGDTGRWRQWPAEYGKRKSVCRRQARRRPSVPDAPDRSAVPLSVRASAPTPAVCVSQRSLTRNRLGQQIVQ